MGDITHNLSRSEFTCKCGCGYSVADYQLVSVVQGLCDYFNTTVTLTSASRCEHHNMVVGGGDDSQHLKGLAADIMLIGVPASDVQARLKHLADGRMWGIGCYKGFTHIDMRAVPARWYG